MAKEIIVYATILICVAIILAQAIIIINLTKPKTYHKTVTYTGKGIESSSVEALDSNTDLVTHHVFLGN